MKKQLEEEYYPIKKARVVQTDQLIFINFLQQMEKKSAFPALGTKPLTTYSFPLVIAFVYFTTNIKNNNSFYFFNYFFSKLTSFVYNLIFFFKVRKVICQIKRPCSNLVKYSLDPHNNPILNITYNLLHSIFFTLSIFFKPITFEESFITQPLYLTKQFTINQQLQYYAYEKVKH